MNRLLIVQTREPNFGLGVQCTQVKTNMCYPYRQEFRRLGLKRQRLSYFVRQLFC